MTFKSSAAVGTLTLPSKQLSQDPLLLFISSIASPFQITVKTPKKGGSLQLELPSTTLAHRNSILRGLCGISLHNALDMHPYYFLGGHACQKSTESLMALSSLNSWMSLAQSSETSLDDLISQLESYLETRSFLIPSGNPTLADLDVYFKVLSRIDNFGPNVARWSNAVSTFLNVWIPVATSNRPTVMSHFDWGKVTVAECPSVAPIFYIEEGETTDATAPGGDGKTPSDATHRHHHHHHHDHNKGSNKGPTDNKPTDKTPATPTPTTTSSPPANDELAAKRAKKAADKAAKKAAKKKNAPPPPTTSTTPTFTIASLDIRVGKILKAWNHPTAEKLYCEEIDVGEDQPRQIASGLRPFYKLDDMQHRTVLVLCNLKTMKLVGFPSHGMVLCASNADHTEVEFVVPPEGAKPGDKVVFKGVEGEVESEGRMAKKKVFEVVGKDLMTDGEGVVVWKGVKGCVGDLGACRSVGGMKDASVG